MNKRISGWSCCWKMRFSLIRLRARPRSPPSLLLAHLGHRRDKCHGNSGKYSSKGKVLWFSRRSIGSPVRRRTCTRRPGGGGEKCSCDRCSACLQWGPPLGLPFAAGPGTDCGWERARGVAAAAGPGRRVPARRVRAAGASAGERGPGRGRCPEEAGSRLSLPPEFKLLDWSVFANLAYLPSFS